MKKFVKKVKQIKSNAALLSIAVFIELVEPTWTYKVLLCLKIKPMRKMEIVCSIGDISDVALGRCLNSLIKNKLVVRVELEKNSNEWYYKLTDEGVVLIKKTYPKLIKLGMIQQKSMAAIKPVI